MAEVIHSEADQVFTILPEGVTHSEPATLKYIMVSETEIDFSSTFVPPALRNQGLAEKLVREGLKWAREKHYHIMASCWYVDKFLQRGK